MTSETAATKAANFLKIAGQFRLGDLVTESPHPRNRDLSDRARENPVDALTALFDIDLDVLVKYQEWADSREALPIAREIATRVRSGGKIFFVGCGATGRLSIQLTAMWRDYWRRKATDQRQATAAGDFEHRAFSVMAGGDFALIKSVEGFEDYAQFGRRQIDDLGVAGGDIVFAITEGGETSFVIGAAWKGVDVGARVFFIYNNPDDILCRNIDRSREVIEDGRIQKINLTTGPMAITGSTRMQATSIQLCVTSTLLEIALGIIAAEIAGESAPDELLHRIPAQFISAIYESHATLSSRAIREQIAALAIREESVYRARKRNNYFADKLGIDVLTDTTERSPTFCIPAFKKFDDRDAAESWSFLFLPYDDTETAWKQLLKRDISPVEWDMETLRSLIGDSNFERQYGILRKISRDEILRFRVGIDGLPYREFRDGDTSTAIIAEEELPRLIEETGFYRVQLERAHRAGAAISVVIFASPGALRLARRFLESWPVPALPLLVPIPSSTTEFRLQGPVRVCAKMLLNALSTLTMVRLGRVMGNMMIWVVPSNLKLIDRSTRYIQYFTALSYEDACKLLHEAIEYVAPRMNAGKEYPSAVGLSVIVSREKCAFEEAEKRLYKELRQPTPAC